MLNFRKLKQDFSSAVLKEGKTFYEKEKVLKAKIIRLDSDTVRFSGKVQGNYHNTYESEIEIDRLESQATYSNCDCTYQYDCKHIAALVFYLEENIDSLLVDYSKETDISQQKIRKEEKEELLQVVHEAKTKEIAKRDACYQKQILDEYAKSANFLSSSPFFLPEEKEEASKAELAFIYNPEFFVKGERKKFIEFQLALRLPFRSKPLNIPNIKEFLEALRYGEKITIASKKYFFSTCSFEEKDQKILKMLLNHARFFENEKTDRLARIALLDVDVFGDLLFQTFQFAINEFSKGFKDRLEELPEMSSIFSGSLENPLHCSFSYALLRFDLQYLEPPVAGIILNPSILVDNNLVKIERAIIFECATPGIIYEGVYFCFFDNITRNHLINLPFFQELTIPEPLFGTFVENALPEMKHFAVVANEKVLERFTTLPFAGQLKGRCILSYVEGELEAELYFSYDGKEVRSSFCDLRFEDVTSFVTEEGIVARNLVAEKEIVEGLFQDFVFNPEQNNYICKSEKKIVEFMTEIIPRHKHYVAFECPQNLLDQFIYDKTTFKLYLDISDKVGYYTLQLKVNGALRGVKLDTLWDCMASKRSYIELADKKKNKTRFSKILVLNLERLSKLIQVFDEMGINKLENSSQEKPLWGIVGLEESVFKGLPLKFSMSDRLKEIRSQITGERKLSPLPIPKEINAKIRLYQQEGCHWLEKLRNMYLNGILADDMGLGKTLQAIVAITQLKEKNKGPSLIVCPTSLLCNWQEEITKFNPILRSIIIDGVPHQRKKLIEGIKNYDIAITSYTLMQKDIDQYKNFLFGYAILDEAQHIKNKATRNARSVKQIKATHKMILTGTPIENSLEELWSLFDFLMPGFLSTFDRFVEKYIRSAKGEHQENMEHLKRKISPFILRRMKEDVLKELPPVSEIVYHCQLKDGQQELYSSYARSARDELLKLVERDGFEKVKIHVLATLTRLKQICCHPAIFAKEKAETRDSAKYEMLLELLQTLIGGKHKIVIFSQYANMLRIMKEDFEKRGIRFSYLDGTTKNRLQIVKEFNEDREIPVFLVSLKAGGTGLNIVGADTVIHYDMWWNPAVEEQGTGRVHRIGQDRSVSVYKLITLNSIEERILKMQQSKKGLVKKVVSSDDEVISKLTWEDVLELLSS